MLIIISLLISQMHAAIINMPSSQTSMTHVTRMPAAPLPSLVLMG